MSIATAITNAQGKVADAYTAISNKGGTLPATQNLSNMPTAIGSIPTGGITPTGTISITQNGTYDVTNYASADVNVSGGGGSTKYGMSLDSILGDVDANGVLQTPSVDANLVFTGVTNIAQNGLLYSFYSNEKIKSCSFQNLTTISGANAMNNAFRDCTNLTSVDLSNLTTVSSVNAMLGAFYGCTSLANVDLSSLTTVSGQTAMNGTFRGCLRLTNVDLSSLTTVSAHNAMNYTFYGCTGLASVNFNNLQTIGANNSNINYGQFASCFSGCSYLTSITFPKLEKIYCTGGSSASYGTFTSNNKIQKMYFPKLDTITYGSGATSSNQNACKYIFSSCSSLTELHFGAANQSAIEATAGYSTAWGRGAGNVTIYFDL